MKAINKPESIGSMKGVKIEIPNPPNWFIVKGTSLLGPQNIQTNNSYSFKIDFEIAQNAPAGDYNVAINILMDTPNSEPLYWDTVHHFAIQRDIIPPVISGLVPLPGAVMQPPVNSISASASDNEALNPGTAGIWLNGAALSTQFTPPGGTPKSGVILANNLNITQDGIYGAGAKIHDTSGNSGHKIWQFMISSGNNAIPGLGDPIIYSIPPDETYDVSNGVLPAGEGFDSFASTPDVAILNNGYVTQSFRLLDSFHELLYLAKLDDSIETLQKYPVLVIPSGGLNGIASGNIKNLLEQYVGSGGNIICLAQANGSDMSFLPGSMVGGYGYIEDQSCYTQAGYVTTYRPYLCGMANEQLNGNIDGYFTKWPDNSTIVMRRIKNTMPIIFEYTYGQGRVIVSNLYTDFGVFTQSTQEEQNILRDLITWAKDPDQDIPEFRSGQTVNLSNPIVNSSSQTARTVQFRIYDPWKNTMLTKDLPLDQDLSAGSQTMVNLTFNSNSTVGIWQVNYALKDAQGNILFEEKLFQRFAVSNYSVGAYNPADFTFAINSTKESYAPGETAAFTVHIWNNTSTDKNIKVNDSLGIPKEVFCPAHSDVSYITTQIVPGQYPGYYRNFTYTVQFFDAETGKLMGSSYKVFKLSSQNVSIQTKVNTEKSQYLPGETVNIDISCASQSETYNAAVKIYDKSNNILFEKNVPVSTLVNDTTCGNTAYIIPPDLGSGNYLVVAEISTIDGAVVSQGATSFELPLAKIMIKPALVDNMSYNNMLSFELGNSGLMAAHGTLQLALFDPADTQIWTSASDINLNAGQNQVLSLPLNITKLVFGAYKLKGTLTYEGRVSKFVIEILNNIAIQAVFNKSSYQVNENMNLTATIANMGKFKNNLIIRGECADAGFSKVDKITLSSNQTQSIDYAIPLPTTLNSGSYRVRMWYQLEGESEQQYKDYYFTIPKINLVKTLTKAAYTSGETISLKILNKGGINGNFEYALDLYNASGQLINSNSGNVAIYSAQEQVVSVSIPAETVLGEYRLSLRIKDLVTQTSDTDQWTVYVDGISASLSAKTDKHNYSAGEVAFSSATIINGAYGINSGSLKLEIKKSELSTTGLTIEAENPVNDLFDLVRTNTQAKIYDSKRAYVLGIDSYQGSYQSGDGEVYISADAKLTVPQIVPGDYVIYVWAHSFYAWGGDNYNLSGSTLINEEVVGTFYTNCNPNYPMMTMAGAGYIDGNTEIKFRNNWEIGVPLHGFCLIPAEALSPEAKQLKDGLIRSSQSPDWGTILSMPAPDEKKTFYLRSYNTDSPSPNYLWSDADVQQGMLETYWIDSIQAQKYANLISEQQLNTGNIVTQFKTGEGEIIAGKTVQFKDDHNSWHTTDLLTDGDINAPVPQPADWVTLREIRIDLEGSTSVDTIKIFGKDKSFADYYYQHIYYTNDPNPDTAKWTEVPYIRTVGDIESLTASNLQINQATFIKVLLLNKTFYEPDNDWPFYHYNYITEVKVFANNWHPTAELAAADTTSGKIKFRAVINRGGENGASPLIDKFNFVYLNPVSNKVVSTQSIPLDLSANEARYTATDLGALSDNGKYFLESSLWSGSGQKIDSDSYMFYVSSTPPTVSLKLYTNKDTYKPGEEVAVTAELYNGGTEEENNVNLVLYKGTEPIYDQNQTLAIGEKKTISLTFKETQPFVLKGVISNKNIVEYQLVEVAEPQVELTVTGPDTVGQGSFDLGILVKNSGQVETNCSGKVIEWYSGNVESEKDLGQIALKPGETKYISQSCQISKDTDFEIKLTGDGAKTIIKKVKFGCIAQLNITTDPVYPASTLTKEEMFEIPVQIVNNGTVDLSLSMKWQVTDSQWQFDQINDYYVPAGGSIYDYLLLKNVPAGEYVLSYNSSLLNGTAIIKLAVVNAVETISISSPRFIGQTMQLQAAMKNIGANEFVGNINAVLCLQSALSGKALRKVWEEERELTLVVNEQKTADYVIPVTNLPAGEYDFAVHILLNGMEINTKSIRVDLKPEFVITSFDDNLVFNAGSQGSVKTKVKNTGPVGGMAEVSFNCGEVVDKSLSVWLNPGEEKELTFTFVPADDLEEKQYIGYINIDDLEQQVKFYVNGYKIGVTSSFDQLAYKEGETAHLTLTLTNDGSLDAKVFTKVNFNNYQTTTDKVTIAKGTPVALTFDVPVHHTGAKLFYGVYHESGRSLNLNTLYVYKQEGSVSFIADKQQYQAGENMSLTLLLTETGILSLDAPGYQSDVNIVSVDTQTITFALPVDMITGTHYINYTFIPSSGTVQQGKLPIDVVGYTIKVLETTLDKGTYYPNDKIKFKTRIDSNKTVPDTLLKIWLKNSGKVVEWYSGTVNLAVGQNTLNCEGSMTLTDKGMGQLIFGMYKGDLLLSAGQKAFDVDIHDTEAPATIIQRTGDSVQVSGKIYITNNTQMYFVATDTGASPSGIDFTEYAVDASTWTVFASSFTLSGEGEHTVKYRSKDKAGNLEDTKQAAYILDNTSSLSQITVNSAQVIVNEEKYLVSPASFTITATDLGSGIDHIEYSVDSSTTPVISNNIPIDITLLLNDGAHTIKYRSIDKLGNKEAEKTLSFLIDGNAPETKLQIVDGTLPASVGGQGWQIADKTYINSNSKITLTAADSGAGLDKINYRVDTGTITIYSEPFSLTQEGLHTIYYSAIDKLGTIEAEKSYVLYVDTTTPETSFKITDSSYEVTEGTTTYVNSSAPFLVSALDPLSNGVSSGLKHITTKLDANEYTTILSSSCYISANSPDGLHTIAYYAVDNVANTETVKNYTAIFDRTKPTIKSTYPANNAKVKAKQAVPITITFTEPVKSADWAKSIEIRESGKVVEWYSKKDFSITYDTTTYTISIDGKLKNNTEYEVILKNTISDRVRNYLDACWFSFRTMMEAAEGGTFNDTATGLTMIVPPNCLPCDGYFEIALLDQINPPKLPKPLKWLFDGQKAYQVIFYDVDGNIVQQLVKKAFQVVLALNQQWIALAMESDPIEYKNIKVYQTGSVSDFIASMAHQAVSASTEKSRFAPRLLAEQSYNAQAQELIVEMDSFGMFALAGFNAPGISLADLSCYPNPFNPCKQDITIQYYLLNDSDVAIAVYDLLGNLVKTWEIPAGDMNARTGLNQLTWNGRNGSGDIVANGGYILFVHSDNQKKKFKILVVK